jgi:hypothetical protein
VDEDFKGSFLSRSASPVRLPVPSKDLRKKKISPDKKSKTHKKGAMTYKDIEIVDTVSIKQNRSGNHLGSLTATNKNMKKKQTWMGRKKSV